MQRDVEFFETHYSRRTHELQKRLDDVKEDMSDDERAEIELEKKECQEILGNIEHYVEHRWEQFPIDLYEKIETRWRENYAEEFKAYCQTIMKTATRHVRKYVKTLDQLTEEELLSENFATCDRFGCDTRKTQE